MERPRVKLNAQVYDEAATWFVQCRAGDLDESGRHEFDRWLRKSPEHVSAYLEVAAIWGEGPALDPTNKWDVDTLVAEASADVDNVVALRGVAGATPPETIQAGERNFAPESNTEPKIDGLDVGYSKGRGAGGKDHLFLRVSKRRLLALAASLAGFAAIGGAWLQLASPVYATAIGEQRSIELSDGSTVILNSKSKVRVRYSKTERLVDLLEGQALFHVAQDSVHPFIVSASGTRVRAVGTQFDVYQRRSSTTVTVLEGRVAILPTSKDGRSPNTPWNRIVRPDTGGSSEPGAPLSVDTTMGKGPSVPRTTASSDTAVPSDSEVANSSLAPALPIVLSAGEQLMVTPKIAQKIEHANVAAATAWRDHQIVFESATLADVAEEFNRYNERQLVIEHPDLLTFHVSGVFSSTDPESLIRFLRDRPGVTVTEEGSQIRITKKF